MPNSAVRVENLHIDIPVYFPGRERLIRLPRKSSRVGGNIELQDRKLVVQALKGISFDLRPGERLALIGPNGAGKSTLLRALAGILPPSRGKVIVDGTVGCVFDITGGLSTDLTGYECIKYQSLLSGFPRDKWPGIAEDVAEFTELGAFLNLPVRTYSDGMRARLFAALATAWKHDILLIDEGIGAGDLEFQEKVAERSGRFIESANILVIASHNFGLLQRFCNKGAVLRHGELHILTNLEDALEFYLRAA